MFTKTPPQSRSPPCIAEAIIEAIPGLVNSAEQRAARARGRRCISILTEDAGTVVGRAGLIANSRKGSTS
jgi:hypothetical protein